MKNNILLIHRYFLPDTPPYATMLSYIAEHIAKNHNVSVLSTQPSYKHDVAIEKQLAKEIRNGYEIQRLNVPKENRTKISTRLIATVVYLAKVFFAILKRKPDIVMVSTAPAVLSGFIVSLAARITKSDFYYHCQDIHPEIAALSGQVKGRFIFKILKYLDVSSCKCAKKIIVISDDMRNSLVERGICSEKIHVIGNFAIGQSANNHDVSKRSYLSTAHFNILFAGNIGRFQALDRLVELAKSCQHEGKIRFTIMGSGTYLESIKQKVASGGLKNVIFLPHQPIDVARSIMREAQLCVVSLNEEIYKYAYPSKTLTYLAESRPLLAIVEEQSQLARIIKSERIGIVINHSEVSKGKDQIIALMKNMSCYVALSENAKDYFSRNLLKEEILKAWSLVFVKEKA